MKAVGHEGPCNYGPRISPETTRDTSKCGSEVRSALVQDGIEKDIAEELERTATPTHLPPETLELERIANERIAALEEEPTMPDPVPETPVVLPPEGELVPLIPPALTKTAIAIGMFLVGLAAALSTLPLPLPDWVVPSIGALGTLALYLGGKAADMPAVRALVPASLVPVLMTLSLAAGGIGAKLPAGKLQTALLVVSGILGFLAGKYQPKPMVMLAKP